MKKIIIIIFIAMLTLSLFSVIDRTISIDPQLMQQFRQNLSQPYTDPLVGAYISGNRNDPEGDISDCSEERVIYFNQQIANMARTAFYSAIRYNSLGTYQILDLQEYIKAISGDPTSNRFIYIKPDDMTSANQSVDGTNPGSIVQLIYNTDNNYAYDPIPPFNANDITAATDTLSNYDRLYYASNGLTFVSFIYDMLYYEMTDTQKIDASNNIDILSTYLYNYLQRPTLIGLSPWTSSYAPFWANLQANGNLDWSEGGGKVNLLGARPLETICALGYSRVVLGYLPGNDEILDWVIYMLTSVPIQEDFHGILSYIVKKSGAHVSGYDYASQAFEGPPQIFFTALNRLSNVNLWNNQYIKKWMNSTVDCLTPKYATVPIEDSWWKLAGTDYGFLDRGLAEYYYQNTDDFTGRNKIKWFIYRQKESLGYWPTTKPLHYHINFPVAYAYNPNNPITADNYQPLSSLSGIFSNQEYTHLSAPLSGGQNYESQTYKNRLWLHVNHESSYEEENFHTDQEKGHFRVFLDQKQFIIDPGYRAAYDGDWWRTLRWCRSIYSKNMVVVNPETINESLHINKEYSLLPLPDSSRIWLNMKRPLSGSQWSQYTGINNLVDNCKREYLFTNQDIRHLKVRIDYNDLTPNDAGNVSYTSPVNDIDAQLVRNFYTLGNEGIIVYDKITSLDGQNNTYRNQLHFHPDAVMNFDPNSGVFSAFIGSSQLYGTMGALASSSTKRIDGQKIGTSITDTLFPNGLPTGDESTPISSTNIFTRAHSRIRVDTGSSPGSSFLTMLIPSSNATNPITTVVESANGYSAYANIDTNNQIYASVSNLSQQMINGLRFTTDADLFYTRSNHDFSDVKSLIINNGNSVIVRDYSENSFGEIELLHGYADNIEEYIVEWQNSHLTMTISSANSQYPRVKVIRNGVSPENLSAKLLYSINWDETAVIVNDEPISRGVIQNVIQSLAYDANYFYINYTWGDLENAGLVCDGFTIAKGSIPETVLNANIVFNGQIIIEGNITIESPHSLTIQPNSNISFAAGFGIYNHGSLIIDGGTSRTISLNSSAQQWKGITSFQEGVLICTKATINNASTGLLIRGMASIVNNDIQNCGQGISVETSTPFTAIGNTISHNVYGIRISNNYSTSDVGYIENNDISENGYGIVLYNSNTKIALNNVYANTRGGIYLIRGSDPIVKDNNISYSENATSTRPEITLESESYPIIDDARNDINTDGLGYSLYYASVGKIKQLVARNNYWGSTNSLQIRNSIYPPLWNVIYDPYCLEPTTFFPQIGDNLFKQALCAEENGDKILAKQLFESIVSAEPDSLYALQSLGRLNSIYAMSDSSICELRNVYSSYMAACSDSTLKKDAEIKLVMIDRFDGLYQYAVQAYETALSNASSEIDSLLCLLDISYTLQELYYANQEKGINPSVAYNANGLSISSIKDAKQAVDILWNRILIGSDSSLVNCTPIPTKLDIVNYPNPFNPSTTFAFNLPDKGDVRISIYNIRGQKVNELINGSMMRGFHKVTWDGRDKNNHSVGTGLYFVKLECGNSVVTRKVMMLK